MLKRIVVIVVATVVFTAGGLHAAPPAQFQAWGSHGPNEPALEAGWTELREPVRFFPESEITAEERQRGFLITVPDPMTVIGPEAVPLACERATALNLFAPRGEYDSASFVLHAIAPLADVQIAVGELRSIQGHAIPADWFDVRFVRSVRVPVDQKAKTFRREPFLLEKRKTVSASSEWRGCRDMDKTEGPLGYRCQWSHRYVFPQGSFHAGGCCGHLADATVGAAPYRKA